MILAIMTGHRSAQLRALFLVRTGSGGAEILIFSVGANVRCKHRSFSIQNKQHVFCNDKLQKSVTTSLRQYQ